MTTSTNNTTTTTNTEAVRLVTYTQYALQGAAIEDRHVEICPDCLEIVGTWDLDYVDKNPNGFDISVEEAYARHRSGACKMSHLWDTVDICPHCGEEVWRGNYEYVLNNPTGSDMAREEAMDEHCKYYCPVLVDRAWETWRKEAGAKEDETPFFLVKRLREEDKWEELYSIPTPPDREEGYWEEEIENMLSDLRKRD